jgi:hypothetical protein
VPPPLGYVTATFAQLHAGICTLHRSLNGFVELRAGACGRFDVSRGLVNTAHPLLAAAKRWTSVTPYSVTRHAKHLSAFEALGRDVHAECTAASCLDPRSML